jgi:hypothetical protein
LPGFAVERDQTAMAPISRSSDVLLAILHNSHNSFTTHQHAQTKLKPSVKVEHLAHVTAASFSCSRHATCTALTDTDQSRHTPGQPRV